MLEIKLKEAGKIERLTNKTFKFDRRYKKGFYAAKYFMKTKTIAEKDFADRVVTMQWFTRDDSMVCGIDESIALLKTFAKNPKKLEITALNDGDLVKPLEPVLKVKGVYKDFGYLEGSIDGILSRRTSVATNCYEVMMAKSANSNIMFFGDRDDDPCNQKGDGYSAYVAGVKALCCDAMGKWVGLKGIGTMPHALILLYKKDLLAAAKAYHTYFPEDKLTVLVDTNDDVITDTLKVADYFKDELFAVRIDTSKGIEDKYFETHKFASGVETHGVNVTLVKALRKALDDHGYKHVKIVVSSGFNVDKVKLFTKENAPVDTYGIGGSLIKCSRSFTGDVVNLEGEPMAKVGRQEMFSNRLKKVK